MDVILGMDWISPGHKIPRTETEPEKTENRTEKYRTEKIRFLFGSHFSGTEFTEVNSVFTLGLPKYLIWYRIYSSK
jgi:hypothetical protein